MNDKLRALKAAFPGTIPVMTGFLFLGMAFGIMLEAKGYGFFWCLLMSGCIYAGSMQYVAITLLTTAFQPVAAFLMTLMVNARHLFYGLALLDKFKGTGKMKPYLIFGLTDETFSILCATPTMAKNSSMSDYRKATGFEALLGYLYLKDEFERVVELTKIALERLEFEI